MQLDQAVPSAARRRSSATPVSRRAVLGGILGTAGLLAVPGLVACGSDADPATPGARRNVRLNFGVIGSTSSHYLHFVAKANVINKYVDGVNMTVVAAGSPTENVPRMVAGEFDMSNFSPPTGLDQYKGLNAFAGKAMPELRIWFNDVDFGNVFLVRQDAGVNSLSDLTGKPYNPGIPGSSADLQTRDVLAALGITPDYRAASLEDAVEALRNRGIVGYTKATGVGGRPDASMLELEAQVGLKALSLTADQEKQVKAKFPSLTTITIPSGVAPDLYPQDSIVLGAGLGQAVLSDFDADLLYDLTAAIVDHQDEIDQAFPGYGGYDLVEQTLKYATIPLHSGAVRYLKEKGATVPAELIPPEYTD